MPAVLHQDSSNELHGSTVIDIGLVNNASDAGLPLIERQFLTLLDSASDGIPVRLSLYALPDVPRTDLGRRHISRLYSSIEDLSNRQLDGLIVTGTEPCSSNLVDEPYWPSMIKVLEWAEHNTHSSVWSCLAAHAAVLHFDGVARRRFSEKCVGLLECDRVSEHELTSGFPSRAVLPHSRWHDIPEAELTAGGYRVLTRTEDAGVDAFIKLRKSLLVCFQGHPEYEARTLLLEYGRDIKRYLRRESDSYPSIPRGYFDLETVDALTALRERAIREPREELFAEFQSALAGWSLTDTWRSAAASIYRNWLKYLCAMKDQRLRKRQGRSASATGKKVASPARRPALP